MASPDRSSPLVLVVDDEADFRTLIGFVLEGAGFRVVTAEDGAQGLESFRAQAPDLVILDVNMPNMDGQEACRMMRRSEGTRRTPILMLTVRSEVETASRCLASGADDYVLKPFEEGDLLRRVRVALGR